MVEAPILKFLFSDDSSLHTYLKGEFPSLKDVSRRLVMESRNFDRKIADHHYNLAFEPEMIGIQAIGELINKLLLRLSGTYLIQNEVGGEIFVRENCQTKWQQLIPFIPPLLTKASFLANYTELPDFLNENNVEEYLQTEIIPVCRYSAIPPAFNPRIQSLVASTNDLHVHLNGSTETDVLWQDFLKYPTKIYKELGTAFKSSSVIAGQLEQESHLLRPYEFYSLLRIAKKLRLLFYDLCIRKDLERYGTDNAVEILNKIIFKGNHYSSSSTNHPFKGLLPFRSRSGLNCMAIECLMMIKIIKDLKADNIKFLDSFFHLYLLIYGLANRLVVHQPIQFGFDHFQKITLNRLREISEEKYDKRFLQIFGNELNLLQRIEGRISPKPTQRENIALIDQVLKGWSLLKKDHNERNHGQNTPELTLVMHFIKKMDNEKDSDIRHKHLRLDIWKRAKIIGSLIKRSKYNRLLVGIDAASNELHAPPEVFAPAFRKLRRVGIRKFTFHVGEEFSHPLSGLRAIYEAVKFLDLREKDRIGHATAAGIKYDLWQVILGKHVFIREGEWLDNLVFIYYLASRGHVSLQSGSKGLLNAINFHCTRIYNKSVDVEIQIKSWLFRKYCPILALSDRTIVTSKSIFDREFYVEILQNKLSVDALNQLRMYHSIECRNNWNTVVEVQADKLISFKLFERIQNCMLKMIKQQNIIIETLPTSNVRISTAKSFDDYHLVNWIQKGTMKIDVPDIVVGTDDTGIFSTNLLNEYVCIYEVLRTQLNFSPSKSLNVIKRLINNALAYKF